MLIRERKAAGFTQVTLARKLRRHQSFVSNYERGERRLDLIEFLDVAAAIGFDPSKFVAEFGRIS